MEALLFALAFGLLLAAGSGSALLLLPRGRRLTIFELGSLSLLLGAGFVSLAAFLIGFFFAGWPMRTAIATAALVLAAIGWSSRGRVELVWWPVHSWRDWLATSVLLLQVLIVVWASLRLALGFDGLFLWESKAQLIHHADGVMPAALFRAPAAQLPHPNYPLLVPLTESWFYGWMGQANQGMVKLVSPLFYAAIIGTLASGGARLGGNRWRGVIPAALLFFLPWAVLRTTAGEADLPLAAFYLAAVVYLLESFDSGNTRLLLLVGLLSALLPWVKREGVILWACLLAVVLIRSAARGAWRGFLTTALPGVLWLAFWRAFLILGEVSDHPEYLPLAWTSLSANIGRVPVIGLAVLREVTDWRHWSLTWLLPLAGIAHIFLKRGRSLTLSWVALIFAPMLLYSSIYIFSWRSVEDLVASSLARLLLHLAPVALLGIALIFPGSRDVEDGGKAAAE